MNDVTPPSNCGDAIWPTVFGSNHHGEAASLAGWELFKGLSGLGPAKQLKRLMDAVWSVVCQVDLSELLWISRR